jgi:hypothetical protein
VACGVIEGKESPSNIERERPRSRVNTGLIAGIAFAMFDIIPIVFTSLPERNTEIIGYAVNRKKS